MKKSLFGSNFAVLSLALAILFTTFACTREIIKEVPVEKLVVVEKPVIREVEKQVIIEKPVEKIVEKEKIVEARVIQVGELQPSSVSTPTGWDTEWSQKLDIKLLATLDSSGPDAWDASKHPLVYVTTLGPGYAGMLGGKNNLPGLTIIDGYTREIVAYRTYDLGAKNHFEPHGIGVSPDGKFIYLPTGLSAGFSDTGQGRLLIINARTLKLQQILATQGNPHHIKSFIRSDGKPLVQVENFRDSTVYVLDPNDNNRVAGGIGPNELRGSGYLSFADPAGKFIYIGVRTPFGTEGGVAVVDAKTWKPLNFISVRDSSPIWVTFTADGKYAFVTGGHESIVAKIDTSKGEVVGMARAGTEGPYGVNLTWDEKFLWTIGKGEGSHNLGVTMGLVDAQKMGRPLGEFYTAAIRADHALLHPDPKVNELWISANASFETVVWDIAKRAVKARIPNPLNGSTHNGAFVRYNPNFSGEVISDQNGLQGSARQRQRRCHPLTFL